MHYVLDDAIDCAEETYSLGYLIYNTMLIPLLIKFEQSDVVETAPTESAV